MQIYIVFTQLCYIMMQKEWHFNFKKGVLKHADFASMAEISFPKTWEDAPGKPPTGGQLKVAAFHRTPSAKNLDPPQILLAVRSLSKGSSKPLFLGSTLSRVHLFLGQVFPAKCHISLDAEIALPWLAFTTGRKKYRGSSWRALVAGESSFLFRNAGYNIGSQWGWCGPTITNKCETINKIICIENPMVFKYTTNYN